MLAPATCITKSPTNNREAMEQFFHSKMGEKYTVFSEKCADSLSVIAKVKGFKFGSCWDHLDV
jgi:hypothetical protein